MPLRSLTQRIRNDVVLRGGLISAFSTLIVLLVLSAVFWVFLTNRLERRIENSLTNRHEVASSNQSVFSDEDRQVIRKFRQTLPLRDEGVFAWLNSEGVMFSGNVDGLECIDGFYDRWLDISSYTTDEPLKLTKDNQKELDDHDRFRFLAKRRDENCLIFGRSMYEVDALSESAKSLLMWLLPLCLLPAIAMNLSPSWKLRKRLNHIGDTMQEVSDGNLQARITVNGNDDLDKLSNRANLSISKLQESVSTLQQLSSVMAHDLRAPLNRVSLPLDEAIRLNQEGKPAVEPLLEVESGLNDSRAIFDALLRISQIESANRRSNFASVDLSELVRDLVEIYEPVLEESSRTLKFEIQGEGTTTIFGDADLIRQAVVNLIENAARYTPDDAVICAGVACDSEYLALFVKDNGKGIPAEERPRVLGRLYRYEGTSKGKSGHGLGLSLVKAIADLHHGELKLEDAQPGLLVIMHFPVQRKSNSRK